MGARVTASAVKELVETEISNDIVESSMIETANAIIDEHLLGKLSQRILDQVELYLAAHFLALVEERGALVRSDVGTAEEHLQEVYSRGFNMTRFGQQAQALDTSGTLTRIGTTKLKAEFRVV